LAAEEEEGIKKDASLTALWESTMIDVDQACKVQPDNTQLLRDLEVTETSLCSNIDGVSVVFSATNRS